MTIHPQIFYRILSLILGKDVYKLGGVVKKRYKFQFKNRKNI